MMLSHQEQVQALDLAFVGWPLRSACMPGRCLS
jgi:hypothetical protein